MKQLLVTSVTEVKSEVTALTRLSSLHEDYKRVLNLVLTTLVKHQRRAGGVSSTFDVIQV
jgi:hypothetical protein